jgi:Ca2+-transporting ATPase
MFLTGVSLAVAAIPEGLPVTVTVALAAGVRRLAGKNAIVRRLPGVETLGCASVICTDKTGTLTKNQLTVQHIYSEGQLWQVSGVGYNPEGAFFKEGKPARHPLEDGLILTLTAGVLCSDARVIPEKESVGQGDCSTSQAAAGRWSVMGDPLEGALLVAGMKAGLRPGKLRRSFPRLAEVPFDSERGYMAVSCVSAEGKETVYFKGAPEKILAMCQGTWEKGFAVPLTKVKTDKIMGMNEYLSGQALRVIAVAYRPGGEVPGLALDEQEKELIFLGLVGMRDPLRLEVRDAVERCRRAGIKVAMITGDHRNTAQAIGRELGILEQGRSELVITGPELEKMSEGELRAAVGTNSVFARVLPRHKMRLVNAFKGCGEIVAMIGDGVNDAPAVKSADIGVAMGLTGTDVTKEASTIIITDDNFTTVVASIEQGRGIYDNIRKTVRYLLATNVGEVVLMSLTVMSGMPLALLPIQLLFLNLLGDGFPAVALGLDRPAPDVMDQSPRSPNGKFFDRDFSNKILSRGISIGLAGLGSYVWGLRNGGLPLARTITLASLTISQLLHALDCRWDRKVNGRAAGNKYLTGAVGLSALLLAGSIYLPAARGIFKTQTLGLLDWGVVGLGAVLSSIMDRTLGALLNIFRPGREEREVVRQIIEKESIVAAYGKDLKLMPASVR